MQHDKKPRAGEYFHLAPYNWNCAQSLHKSQQALTGLTDEEIEAQYRSKGGGRAEGGLCGAIYAMRSLASSDEEADRLTEAFGSTVGGLTCAQLRDRCGRSCRELVELAESLLIESQHTILESSNNSDQQENQ